MREQQIVLEDHPDRAPLRRNEDPGSRIVHNLVAEGDASPVDRQEAREHPQ